MIECGLCGKRAHGIYKRETIQELISIALCNECHTAFKKIRSEARDRERLPQETKHPVKIQIKETITKAFQNNS